MVRGLESLTLYSESAKELANFYKEKVGLKVAFEGEMGEDGQEIYQMEVGEGSDFYIADHSEVKGKNSTPQRSIFNFEVEKIEEAVSKLDEAGVKKIQDTYHVEGYGYIATFEDLDGNYFQLAQVREG